ncbi:MAG: DUF3488 and DUF4129 domain-containing transglutaminase family protein [Pseudohongiellaceae bacterium]
MNLTYQIPRASLIWLLLSVALVLIPHSARMPIWVSAVAVSCLLWRLLIFSGKLDYPDRWLRVLVVSLTVLLSIFQLRNLGIGLDSAASFLALGFVFKLIEMREKRDVYVVVSLCFVMMMVGFLYSQSLITTVYGLLVVVVVLMAMLTLNKTAGANTSIGKEGFGAAVVAVKILLQALPLTVALFYVFPRIAPLWAVPIQSTGASTGVSDEMSPGDISSLGRSADLAFRVQFNELETPSHEALYWRGLVLTEFDGETWRRSQSRSGFVLGSASSDRQLQWDGRIEKEGKALDYNVIMEPTQKPWLYGLHLAESLTTGLFQSRNFELFNNDVVSQRLSYDLRSYVEHSTDVVLLNRQRSQTVSLPSDGNTRSRDFALRLRQTVVSDRDYVEAVLDYFSQNEFFYTLNPSLLGENRIDDFLFGTQEGFCEHYASTFAYLMRAAGIPSRVIIGYQGAEANPFENYMMVYQYNAHAWNEVWLEGEGWVRFDPTGAVSPERVRLGVEAALRDDPAFKEESLFSVSGLSGINWINSLRLRLDALEYEWNRRVVSYDEDNQFELFEELFGQVTEQKVIALLLGLASAVVLFIAVIVLRFEPRRNRGPIVELYSKVSRDLAKVGLARETGEGPIDYRNRVALARPELHGVMWQITQLYMEVSYQRDGLDKSEVAEYVRKMKWHSRQLKKGLSKTSASVSVG